MNLLAKKSRDLVAMVKNTTLEKLKVLAGADFQKMMESASATRAYLGHSDPKLRKASLFLLYNQWGLGMDVAPELEKMIVEDEDDSNRCVALTWLMGTLYCRTNDPRLGKLGAMWVKDESRSKEFRVAAYLGLFGLRGLPVEMQLKTWLNRSTFPAYVDWEFVDSFLV